MIYVSGRRQYIPATGPGVAVGASGGYTLTVDGQAGATYPQNRIETVQGTVRARARARRSGAACVRAGGTSHSAH
jgi:hypothetical protein